MPGVRCLQVQYFSMYGLPVLLDVGSRLQTYFCARFFRKEEVIPKSKKGAVILVGGGDGHMEKAYETACTLLHHMNCHTIHEGVFSHNTNERPAISHEQALVDMIEFLETEDTGKE